MSQVLINSLFFASKFLSLSYIGLSRLRVFIAMETHLSTQIPHLDDYNFEFWKQSVSLVAGALKIMKYIAPSVEMKDILNDDDRRAVYLLANTMLTSMSTKA